MPSKWLGSPLTTVLIVLGTLTGWDTSALLLAQEPPQAQSEPEKSGLKIVILEGEDGVNIINKKTAVKPVIEVRDKNNLPIAGAIVAFTMPSFGAGGTFVNGGRLLTAVTNSSGRAVVGTMHPVGTGAFKIGVTASFQGQTAAATIAQTNYATLAAANAAGATAGASGGAGGSGAASAGAAGTGAGGISATTIGIIVGVVAAGAIGGVVATKGKGGATTQSTPSATITLGNGSVFGPPR